MIRLGGSIVFFALAIVKMNALYNYIGLIVHYLGDVLRARPIMYCARAGVKLDRFENGLCVPFFPI